MTPDRYSVANVSKRVVLIFLSMLIFGAEFGLANTLGIATTMFGIAMYNREKLLERSAVEKGSMGNVAVKGDNGYKTPDFGSPAVGTPDFILPLCVKSLAPCAINGDV